MVRDAITCDTTVVRRKKSYRDRGVDSPHDGRLISVDSLLNGNYVTSTEWTYVFQYVKGTPVERGLPVNCNPLPPCFLTVDPS